ncbi:unnamed protein product [Prorocentrum cordatum]|uniref:Uncharacterized protein n=1 Tax=Prorocentrum cordatum TaxID=2364126 RepID=A0ABN9T8E1_9DINO|nr:unnamed protein product [Polarella glacialis]
MLLGTVIEAECLAASIEADGPDVARRTRLEGVAESLRDPTLTPQKRRMLQMLLAAERKRQEPLWRQCERDRLRQADEQSRLWRDWLREQERERRRRERRAEASERDALAAADAESRRAAAQPHMLSGRAVDCIVDRINEAVDIPLMSETRKPTSLQRMGG